MASDQEEIEGSRGNAQSGLRRLMLKLPQHRARLATLAGPLDPARLRDLFEIYDEACIALDGFRRSSGSELIIEEYESVCAELEADVVRELA
ncbi:MULTISPECIES: nodulation protein [unclassified Rhizobium]|uniref:nodulation protein n=1 Tax=unclassified Rhizobium TaxID=2613769 RepID=UPI002167D6B5|nr:MULTISPECIES: nodulation protein [unclassified Rhizobium]MCS3743590.1 hypothetical protein [Rhizobium sp. BK661]MCS4096523.1 hypothetical protein [Rhizobium sp. BK176]